MVIDDIVGVAIVTGILLGLIIFIIWIGRWASRRPVKSAEWDELFARLKKLEKSYMAEQCQSCGGKSWIVAANKIYIKCAHCRRARLLLDKVEIDGYEYEMKVAYSGWRHFVQFGWSSGRGEEMSLIYCALDRNLAEAKVAVMNGECQSCAGIRSFRDSNGFTLICEHCDSSVNVDIEFNQLGYYEQKHYKQWESEIKKSVSIFKTG